MFPFLRSPNLPSLSEDRRAPEEHPMKRRTFWRTFFEVQTLPAGERVLTDKSPTQRTMKNFEFPVTTKWHDGKQTLFWCYFYKDGSRWLTLLLRADYSVWIWNRTRVQDEGLFLPLSVRNCETPVKRFVLLRGGEDAAASLGSCRAIQFQVEHLLGTFQFREVWKHSQCSVNLVLKHRLPLWSSVDVILQFVGDVRHPWNLISRLRIFTAYEFIHKKYYMRNSIKFGMIVITKAISSDNKILFDSNFLKFI